MKVRNTRWYDRSECVIVCAVGIGAVILTLVLLGAPASARRPAHAGTARVRPEVASSAQSAAGRASAGWHTVFSETFESGIGADWTVDGSGVAAEDGSVWGTSTYTYVRGAQSAWCAGGAEEPSGFYTDSMDTWLVSPPIELERPEGAVRSAEARFAWWLDARYGAEASGEAPGAQTVQQVTSPPSSGDWFGYAVLTDAEDLESGQWTYHSAVTGGWVRGFIPLDDYLPGAGGTTSTVHLAFRFVSDDDGAVGQGAFVDDVDVRVNFGHEIALPLVVKEPPPAATPTPTPAPTPIATSLLENPSFEGEGNWTDIETGQQPNHWKWHWEVGETFGESSWQTVQPETNVKNRDQIPPEEHDLFFRDGFYCVKVFHAQPIHVALSQDVSGLEVGRDYRFVVPMYVDVVADYDGGEKVAPEDPYAAEVRLGVASPDATWPDGDISWSAPWNGTKPDGDFFLSKHDFSFDFEATEGEMTVYFEAWAKWPQANNGFFLDDLQLYELR